MQKAPRLAAVAELQEVQVQSIQISSSSGPGKPYADMPMEDFLGWIYHQHLVGRGEGGGVAAMPMINVLYSAGWGWSSRSSLVSNRETYLGQTARFKNQQPRFQPLKTIIGTKLSLSAVTWVRTMDVNKLSRQHLVLSAFFNALFDLLLLLVYLLLYIWMQKLWYIYVMI